MSGIQSITGLVLVLLLMSPTVGSAASLDTAEEPGFRCNIENQNRTIRDYQGVEFTVNYSSCGDLSVIANNRAGEVQETSFVVRIDGDAVEKPRFKISPNETQQWTYDSSIYLQLLENNHTVTVTTYGNRTQYNFTRRINTNNTDIPHTRIEDVKVTNGTIDGEPSTVAKVTLSNPSIQMYSTKLMVFTEETDGSLYPASVAPGENRTITVELLDDRGTKVAGEARLYAGNISERDGGLDQVEFVGRAGANTTTWNESYEPVRGPWREDHYVYQNESIETGADKNGIVPDLSETQLLYAGAGVALVGIGGLKRLLT